MARGWVAMILIAAAAASATVAHGQEVAFRTDAMEFRFGEPAGVGLNSYRMLATSIGIRAPIRPWLVSGGNLQVAEAGLTRVDGARSVSLFGMTDVGLFVEGRAGPLRMRGGYDLPLGTASIFALAQPEHGLVGLASHDFLPVPVRSWGRGGGARLDVALDLRVSSLDLTAFAGLSTYGRFEPFVDDSLSYRLGSERRLGLRAGHMTSAVSRIEMSAVLVLPDPDRAGDDEVFAAGSRLEMASTVAFPVGRSSVIARAEYLVRSEGEAGRASGTAGTGGARPFLQGVVDPAKRTLVRAGAQTRTLMAPFPLLASAWARHYGEAREGGSGWLLSGGFGTEIRVLDTLRGRAVLTPMATVHRGRVTVADGYGSSVTAWDVSLTGRWEISR